MKSNFWHLPWRRPAPRQPAISTPKNIREWLAKNTFHHAQFADLKRLVEAKRKSGVKISLCLPTLNEETTIGKEIVIFKSELMTRYPLLDEIAVIDSGSTDATCEIAKSFGASVYAAADILPDQGAQKGKGENLWKAIYQLRGDIIVYVDADIKNIHARFVYGLIGPLLFNPEIQYVKAFYDRPLTTSKNVRTAGGGRVTEILIRPLFSLFFPELTAVIQPLSGEYAARRAVLERIPFPIGYGVETSHLIDIYRQWGMPALAQTDLDQRVHRNQSIQALGKMAFGILQTFLRRCENLRIIEGLPEISHVMRQFQWRENGYEPVDAAIPEYERPPMINHPAYQKRFGRHP
ncbi:MAG: glucosyl-3-phosphoglycerate synthase [Kiritimatiellae bacterium]|nr:glucosyl-3-phosphoglycerate synthase [Kiritimatiellia bacterium]